MPATAVKRLMIADDDQDDRLLFQDALDSLGLDLQVSWATDGDAALNALYQKSPLPEIVFLDVNMPVKNGIECLRDIKSDLSLKHIIVILFSTSVQDETIKLAYNLGAKLFFQKPDTFPKLRNAIEMALSPEVTQSGPLSIDRFVVRDRH